MRCWTHFSTSMRALAPVGLALRLRCRAPGLSAAAGLVQSPSPGQAQAELLLTCLATVPQHSCPAATLKARMQALCNVICEVQGKTLHVLTWTRRCCGRFSAAETCQLLADIGFQNTVPFAEVTGGDLLGLSSQELVDGFGASHFQVWVCETLGSLLGTRTWLQETWSCAHSARRASRRRRWRWCSRRMSCLTPSRHLLGGRR